jgi:hypothetical protein
MFLAALPSSPKNRLRTLWPFLSYSETDVLGFPWSGSMDRAMFRSESVGNRLGLPACRHRPVSRPPGAHPSLDKMLHPNRTSGPSRLSIFHSNDEIGCIAKIVGRIGGTLGRIILNIAPRGFQRTLALGLQPGSWGCASGGRGADQRLPISPGPAPCDPLQCHRREAKTRRRPNRAGRDRRRDSRVWGQRTS